LGFTEVSHEELQRELILLRSHRGAFATSESEGKRRGAVGTRLTMSARAKVKSLLRRIFGLAPHSIKLELKDSFWATLTVFRNARSILRKIMRKLLRSVADFSNVLALSGRGNLGPHPREKVIQFNGGDILLSPGASWSDENYLNVIWTIKSSVDLRFVPVVYDLIPCLFPHFFGAGFPSSFQSWAVDLLWCSDFIFTISESSKRDIVSFASGVGAPSPEIKVLRLGDEIANFSNQGTEKFGFRSGLSPGRFVLMVGTLEVRKNHMAGYYAWRELVRRHGKGIIPELVVVGKVGWLASDVLYLMRNDPTVVGSIRIIEAPAENELAWLYRNCLFTIYPSNYEGWGLPVAESFAFGKPVVASSASSIPEIGGDLGDYHDPDSYIDLVRHAERLIFDKDYYTQKVDDIRNRYQTTSWRQFCSDLNKALESTNESIGGKLSWPH
jgi:glycosyltransferase involved in cell wall biosynthesis